MDDATHAIVYMKSCELRLILSPYRTRSTLPGTDESFSAASLQNGIPSLLARLSDHRDSRACCPRCKPSITVEAIVLFHVVSHSDDHVMYNVRHLLNIAERWALNAALVES